MSIKPNKDRFSLNRQKQKSTLELWQQHLQALRRASQCPQPSDKSNNKRQDQAHDSPGESHEQSPSDTDASAVKPMEMMTKANQPFERSAHEC